MQNLNLFIRFFLFASMWLQVVLGFCQQVKNVPDAFESLSIEPKLILINNEMLVPTEGGHMQGIQAIEKNGKERLLISGSSLNKAYILQADLTTLKTDTLIILRQEPYRHAGGIQASEPYLVVGIEDNVIKKSSKVCLYNYHNTNLYRAQSNITIDREGEAKLKTAGATGLLALDNDYLIVVSNWDSRNWDFYRTNPKKNEYKMIESFAAPDDWASYQSINLILDEEAIYAIGFYRKELVDFADLILVSKQGTFNPIMEKVLTKTFNSKNGVDFSTAAGIQVDNRGKLHVWATQSDALKEITVNKFSQL